jgi:hypothetical protein
MSGWPSPARGGAFAGWVRHCSASTASRSKAAGRFANAGLLQDLTTFIVGHGVLNLAVWIRGTRIFARLALVAPEPTRSDAIRIRGRLATRITGAVVVFLVIAGVIEDSCPLAPVRADPHRCGASSLAFLLPTWGGE